MMGGLVLKLSPKERVLINGAVLENGDRRSRLSIVTPGANILRLKDAVHPDEAKTPVRRVCYAVQLVLTGDSDPSEVRHHMLRRLEELSLVFTDHDSRKHIDTATQALLQENYYHVLKALKLLIPREDRLLAVSRK